MKIEIAGAGAGKTTDLAEKVIKQYEIDSYKDIICVSFTNASVKTISDKLKGYFGIIPSNIKVSTIHSFLNSIIIHPYYFWMYGQKFDSISHIALSDNPRYRNSTITMLNRRNVLHVDEFNKLAKYVICGKSGDKRIIKEKRKRVLQILSKGIGAIYVDEAQDIDLNFFKILQSFDEVGVPIEAIGDPKQDLKGFGQLSQLMKSYPTEILYKKESHRCPSQHLNLSNQFVPEQERQFSPTSKQGHINFYFESDLSDVKKFILSRKYDLKYIQKKQRLFDTQKALTKSPLFEEIKLIVRRLFIEKNDDIDENLLLLVSSKVCYRLIIHIKKYKMSISGAIGKTFQGIELSKQEYARLCASIEEELSNASVSSKMAVESIDRVKGREGENCLFIINSDLIPYFMKQKSDSNKMLSYLYVGLTRSKDKLDILFVKEVESKYSKKEIKDFIENLLEYRIFPTTTN